MDSVCVGLLGIQREYARNFVVEAAQNSACEEVTDLDGHVIAATQQGIQVGNDLHVVDSSFMNMRPLGVWLHQWGRERWKLVKTVAGPQAGPRQDRWSLLKL